MFAAFKISVFNNSTKHVDNSFIILMKFISLTAKQIISFFKNISLYERAFFNLLAVIIQISDIFYPLTHKLYIKRLMNKIIYAKLKGFCFYFRSLVTSNYDNRNILHPVTFFHNIEDIKTVNIRHNKIKNNYRNFFNLIIHYINCLTSIRSCKNIIIFTQHIRKNITVKLNVIYNQNFISHGAAPYSISSLYLASSSIISL